MFECARASAIISKEKIGVREQANVVLSLFIISIHYINKNLKVFNNKGKLKD